MEQTVHDIGVIQTQREGNGEEEGLREQRTRTPPEMVGNRVGLGKTS